MKLYQGFAWNTRLAINGGEPVRYRPLPYGRHTITDEDVDAVARALRSGSLTSGPILREYEDAVAEYVGTDYAVAVSSGTAALHSALAAVGVSEGDQVLTTALTFVATANAIEYNGAVPVFGDIDPEDLQLNLYASNLASNSFSGAVLPVDYGGAPAAWPKRYNDLPVIVDGAHSLGGSVRGYEAGRFGTATAFSTHPCKSITTGEGGIVTTNEEEVAEFIREFRAPGRAGRNMGSLGYNYSLSDINAALGLSQLRSLDAFVEARTAVAEDYNRLLKGIEELELPTVAEGVKPSWHLYVVRINKELVSVDRDTIVSALRAEGINVGIHYKPVYTHSYYEFSYPIPDLPKTEEESSRVISLPIYPTMFRTEIEDVVRAIEKVFNAYGRELPCK
jgi:dTDP-4-amino-4,6-dideoxygalactose transaminase